MSSFAMFSSSCRTNLLVRASQAGAPAQHALAPRGFSLRGGYHSNQARFFWPRIWPSSAKYSGRKRHCCSAECNYDYMRALYKEMTRGKEPVSESMTWFRHRERFTPASPWYSLSRERTSKTKPSSSPESSSSESEYIIDPITNRKVPKHPSHDIDFESHTRSARNLEDTNAWPFGSDGRPPAEEPEKCCKMDIDVPRRNEEPFYSVMDFPNKSHGIPQTPQQPASEAPERPSETKNEPETCRNVKIKNSNEELIHRVQNLSLKAETGSPPAPMPPKSAATIESRCGPEDEDVENYKPLLRSDEDSKQVTPTQYAGTESINKATEEKESSMAISSEDPRAPKHEDCLLPSNSQLRADQSPSTSGLKTDPAMSDYDPYSDEPTGLETSWNREHEQDSQANKMYTQQYSPDGKSSEPTVVSSSGPEIAPETSAREESFQEKENETPEGIKDGYTDAPTASKETKEPTLYKILAYDPTMQTIDVAETTSFVKDSAQPLSPADVMLRLSNPSKFFPHFKPLQDQGFEIVSGSGDVLVFRKVREGIEANSSGNVNPIDMMGRRVVPDMGNFASPTGFVNYDYPIEDESSYTSSCSEEGNSGGRRASAGQQRTEKFSEEPVKARKGGFIKKTAAGVAWLAGTAYGVGVVAEFVKNRGEKPKSTC